MKTVAFILAAGLGTRLAPLTHKIPKALVEVRGIPMLERVIQHLKETGINNIVINVHHHAERIIEFLQENENFGVDITISDETTNLLDTGGAIVKAAPYFMDFDDIIFHNADILTDINLVEMLKYHKSKIADATLLVSHRSSSRYLYFDKDSQRLNGWQNTKDGRTLPTGFRPESNSDLRALAFAGVHIFSTKLIKDLKEYAPSEVFSIIPFYADICKERRILGYVPDEKYQWFDIGSLSKLNLAEQNFKTQ